MYDTVKVTIPRELLFSIKAAILLLLPSKSALKLNYCADILLLELGALLCANLTIKSQNWMTGFNYLEKDRWVNFKLSLSSSVLIEP